MFRCIFSPKALRLRFKFDLKPCVLAINVHSSLTPVVVWSPPGIEKAEANRFLFLETDGALRVVSGVLVQVNPS